MAVFAVLHAATIAPLQNHWIAMNSAIEPSRFSPLRLALATVFLVVVVLFAWLSFGHVSMTLVVAAGLPHPPHFPQPMRAAMALAFVLLPAITRVLGFLPGRQLGFAGRESRGVIRDWVRSGRHGNYRMPGLPDDIEQRLAALQLPVFAMHFAADRFGPEQALYALLDKLGTACTSEVHGLDSAQLGVHANHFAWMQQPEAVARRLGRWARAESQPD